MSEAPVLVTLVGRKVSPASATVKRPGGGHPFTLKELRELVKNTDDWAEECPIEVLLDTAYGTHSLSGIRVLDYGGEPAPRPRAVRNLGELKEAAGLSHVVLRSRDTGCMYSVDARKNLGDRINMRLIAPSQPADPELVFLSSPTGLEIIWQGNPV